MRQGMPDLVLSAVTLALLGLGVVMVASAGTVEGLRVHGDPLFYMKRQLLWALLGLLLMAALVRIDYRTLQPLALPGLGLAILLLVVVLLVGVEAGGGRRWIALGPLNLQASEVAKLATINFLAAWIAERRGRLAHFLTGLLPPLAVLGLLFGLVVLEPDFGTAVLLVVAGLALLFCGGASPWHLGMIGLAGIPGLALLIRMEPYRMRRILAFLDPWKDPLDTGFQTIQSLLAIGSGGLFGAGLGQGKQKFLYLPEQHTDFIFAVLGEELGFVGASLVLILFFLFAWRGLRIALRAPDFYGTMLGTGITLLITLQALLNIGVVTGSLPITGVTLPFLSFGGSSLTITLAGVGILLNLSRHESTWEGEAR